MSIFLLKAVALITMFIDHTGHMLQKSYGYADYVFLREIGRTAFPLYAFMISVGCGKTRDIRKYFLRLLGFAVISEFAFDLFILNIGKPANIPLEFLSFKSQNIFFTLAIGVFCNLVYRYSKEKMLNPPVRIILWGIVTVVMAFFAENIHSDYGDLGVLLITVPFVVSDFSHNFNLKKILHVVTSLVLLYALYAPMGMRYFYAILPAMLLVLVYNGKKGIGGRWFFYIFYPAHLVVLFLIWFVFIRTGNVII